MLESRERSQNRATDPDGVFSLWRCDNLDLHGWRSERAYFLLHSVRDSWEHRGSSGENGVGVKILSDIDIALHDGVVSGLVDTGRFHSEEGWLEESLWASESLVADGDDLGKDVSLY